MHKLFSPLPIALNGGIAVARIVTGFFLIYHGWEVFSEEKMNGYMQWDMFKDSSPARIMVYAGKAAELVGGIFIFLGLFTRLGAVITAVTLAFIAFFVGHGKVWYEDQHPFLFVLLAWIFFFTGPGSMALDHYLYRKTYR